MVLIRSKSVVSNSFVESNPCSALVFGSCFVFINYKLYFVNIDSA